MKKEIREVNTEKGIIRITSSDERWYAKSTIDPITLLPTYEFVPSVTWICESYPKGVGFYKWLANTGWDEAEALKEAAGDKGSKVHAAIAQLLRGETVKMDAPYLNPSTNQLEALSVEEYSAIMSFVGWFKAYKPVLLAQDLTVWNDQEGYAGTIDYLCRIDETVYLIDFKTSKSIWPSHRLQLSAYKHTPEIEELVPKQKWATLQLAVLQLGYPLNKLGYKFTEIEDQYPLFLAAKQIWSNECKTQHPLQRDYPVSLSLASAPTPMTAPASPSAVAAAVPSQKGNGHGSARRLVEEEQQDVNSGRRRKQGSGVSGL